MIWQAVEAVFIVFLMIGAGIFVSWKKWVSRDVAKVFSKLIINLTLPCMLVSNLTTLFTREELVAAWLPLAIVLCVVPVSFLIGWLCTKIFNISKTRRGVFTVLFSLSNSVFIGFPVAQALFGDAGMPFAVLYYLANTTFFWVLGSYNIRRDADLLSGRQTKVSVGEILRKLITPPIVTMVVMFGVVFAQITLPDLILIASQYIGRMTSPLSLIFMGSMIYYLGIKGMRYEKGIGPVMIGRFLLVPALCFGVCTLVISQTELQSTAIDLNMMRNVFTMQTGLPVMTQTVILSELYGADVEYATKNVVWTTLASLVTIPTYMVLFQYI